MTQRPRKTSGQLFSEPEGPAVDPGNVYIANIDGAARGNPGPAAYGLVIRKPDGTAFESLGKYIGRHTNNVAEYYALIAALDYAAAKGIRRLRVLSDSQLIVNQIKGIYKVRHPDLRPLHERARKQAAALDSFIIQHVPREQNREADDMANAALDHTGSSKGSLNPTPAGTSRSNPSKTLWLDDLHVGQKFSAGTYVMEEKRMKTFAAEFDPQPFHLDNAAARNSVFHGLAASGWHTASATMRMLVQGLPIAGGLVGLGGELAWARPTRAGDVLRAELEITAITPSRSKPNQGIVTVRCVTLNQKNEEVQVFTTKILAFKREGSSANPD